MRGERRKVAENFARSRPIIIIFIIIIIIIVMGY